VRYLTADDVMALNEAEAGPDLLADFGFLESAVLRPQTSVFGSDAYPDVHSKAAALLHSLARNHAFIDGNKRTAALATDVFYALNGYVLEAEPREFVGLVLDAAQGLIDVEAIAGQLKTWVREIHLPEE
jgi:death on curing protein